MAFYRKNIRSAEQLVRVAVGVAAAIAAIVYLSGWLAMAAVAGGIGIALSGLVGYCPMCAIAGIDRRSDV